VAQDVKGAFTGVEPTSAKNSFGFLVGLADFILEGCSARVALQIFIEPLISLHVDRSFPFVYYCLKCIFFAASPVSSEKRLFCSPKPEMRVASDFTHPDPDIRRNGTFIFFTAFTAGALMLAARATGTGIIHHGMPLHKQ
jgi:hypothetical protein